MSSNNLRGFVFGACNPMIDVTAHVDLEFLHKYGLNPNDAILGDENNRNIYNELKEKYKEKVTYTSGGSGQNTLRTIAVNKIIKNYVYSTPIDCSIVGNIQKWILNSPNSTLFMGCVGQDKYADILKNKAKEVGLRTLFQTTDKAPTATCAVLITHKNRSLVAHLGAANHFSAEFLDKENNWPVLENAALFYITGFFFTVCYEAIFRIANFALEKDRPFAINTSAIFLAELCKKELAQIFPYVDILFGNDEETFAFAKNVLNYQTTCIQKLARKLASTNKLNAKRKRLVIITQAAKPVVYCIGNKLGEVPVPAIEAEKIVDTSSAGDAFVGGFLAQYVKNEPIEKAIKCGIWASGLIIQRFGCEFPKNMDFF